MQLDMRPGTSLKGEKTKFSGHWAEDAVCVLGGGEGLFFKEKEDEQKLLLIILFLWR